MEELIASGDLSVGNTNLLHRVEECRTFEGRATRGDEELPFVLPNRPVPSAMFRLIDRAARRS